MLESLRQNGASFVTCKQIGVCSTIQQDLYPSWNLHVGSHMRRNTSCMACKDSSLVTKACNCCHASNAVYFKKQACPAGSAVQHMQLHFIVKQGKPQDQTPRGILPTYRHAQRAASTEQGQSCSSSSKSNLLSSSHKPAIGTSTLFGNLPTKNRLHCAHAWTYSPYFQLGMEHCWGCASGHVCMLR